MDSRILGCGGVFRGEPYEEAIRACDGVLAYDYADDRLLSIKGSAFFLLGRKDDALDAWKEALRHHPGDKDLEDLIRRVKNGSYSPPRHPTDILESLGSNNEWILSISRGHLSHLGPQEAGRLFLQAGADKKASIRKGVYEILYRLRFFSPEAVANSLPRQRSLFPRSPRRSQIRMPESDAEPPQLSPRWN